MAQHPDIALTSIKGADLLARRNITTLEEAGEYLAQFEGAENAKILGEVSSVYLHREGVAKKIKQLFPDVKIIA
ncbi:MAG: hypothetical protein SVX43_22685, partial [Cyanobacteriota bacterium]|nr:hypothetical protein [Cyanobacteriota bacterium]